MVLDTPMAEGDEDDEEAWWAPRASGASVLWVPGLDFPLSDR